MNYIKENIAFFITIAIIILIIYFILKKEIISISKPISEKIEKAKENINTVTDVSGWKDLFSQIFTTKKYISQEEQRKAIEQINKKLGIKK